MAASLTCLAIVHITYCTIHLQCSFCEPIFLVLNGNYSTKRHCSYSIFFFFGLPFVFSFSFIFLFTKSANARTVLRYCALSVFALYKHCTATVFFFFFLLFVFLSFLSYLYTMPLV